MEFGLNLGVASPRLTSHEQLSAWEETLDVACRSGFGFVAAIHQWLAAPLPVLSPFAVLAHLSALQPTLTYATGIAQLTLFNPVQFAEEVATLDYLTGGKCFIGIGLGYRDNLFVAAGVRRSERGTRLDEAIAVVKELLTGEEVEFDGRYFHVSGRIGLRPLQQPHPPLVLGGQSEAAVVRAGKLGDGWYVPSQVGDADLERLLPHYLESRRLAGKDGAGMLVLTRNVCIADTDEEALDTARRYLADTYGGYRAWGLEEPSTVRVHRDFDDEIGGRAIVGSIDTCRDRLAELIDRYPITHLQLRPQGPGFSGTDTGLQRALQALGDGVLPALGTTT